MSWLKDKTVRAAIIVSSLGYFVDVYDLALFSIVRKDSLESLGANTMENGMLLLDLQMFGMLLGGFLWGVLGDKKGRVKVLFGSIFMYSLANVLNGFVTNVFQYGVLRFLAGIGLAGEIGAGITLVSELMPKKSRGVATTLVATVGVCGALVASEVGHRFDWRISYIIGGSLGFLLLLLRIKVADSGIYENSKTSKNFSTSTRLFFASKSRIGKLIACTLVGMPIWMVGGVLVAFAPELGSYILADKSKQLVAGQAVFYSYAGIVLGDLGAGIVSQLLKSRKIVMASAIVITATLSSFYLQGNYTPSEAYFLLAVIGFFAGYWAVLLISVAEQFGTNIRATATTSVPNLIRATVIPVSGLITVLRGNIGLIPACQVVVVLVSLLALAGLYTLEESFSRDLDYIEN